LLQAIDSLLQMPDMPIIYAYRRRGINGLGQVPIKKGALNVQQLDIIIIDGCMSEQEVIGRQTSSRCPDLGEIEARTAE
jgi:hypothetical protein